MMENSGVGALVTSEEETTSSHCFHFDSASAVDDRHDDRRTFHYLNQEQFMNFKKPDCNFWNSKHLADLALVAVAASSLGAAE